MPLRRCPRTRMRLGPGAHQHNDEGDHEEECPCTAESEQASPWSTAADNRDRAGAQ